MARKKRVDPKPKLPPRLRSGYEKKVRSYLESEKIPFEYETERIPYTVPEAKKNYIPDWKVKTRTGKTIYVESKGLLNAAGRSKMRLVVEQNPDKDIRLLFQRNNKLNRTSKTTYVMWSTKHGIKCAVSSTGCIPKEWTDE